MTKTLRLTLFLSLVATLLLLTTSHVSADDRAQARLVLVGISDYQDPEINDRKHAETDVQAWQALFLDKKHLGVHPDNVRVLLGNPKEGDKSKVATRANVLKALEWLAKAKQDELAIFVFIGQGGPLGPKGERLCYFTADSTFKDREKNALAADDVRKVLDKLQSRRFCAFVDVDFKGYDTKDKDVPEPVLGRDPYQEFLGDDGSLAHGSLPGRVVYLATDGLSQSMDLKTEGLFTSVLLRGLKGEADTDGYEADGVVTVKELTDYAPDQARALALMYGKSPEQRRQRLYSLGDRNDPVVLSYNPPAAERASKLVEGLKKLHEAGTIDKKLLGEGLKLLLQMPGDKTRQELRKQYQKLVDGKSTLAQLQEERTKILKSLELSDKVAEAFADEVLKDTGILIRDYVKKLDQGELVTWAVRGLYHHLGESVPAGIDDTLSNAKKLKKRELRNLLINARKHLGNRAELKDAKDVHVAMDEAMKKLDKYSTFIDPDEKEDFDKGTSGEYTGIGVQVQSDRVTRMLKVITPMKGGPAIKVGLQAGDLITEIIRDVDRDGKKLEKTEVIPTLDLSVSDAVKKILGKRGTPVKLKIKREEKEPFVVEIKRDRVQVETVMGAKRLASTAWDFMIDKKAKIGYVRLTQFNRTTNGEMIRAMIQLKNEGVKALVLDMRFNPGGLLYSAREICDMFVDDGLLVEIRPREGKPRRLFGFSEGSYLDFPMVCLVNGSSASGAEIVAACLQDHGRALVMGSRSFGKGTVQNIMQVGGATMKVTTASFWPPSGRNLNKDSTKGRDQDDWGVRPDKGYGVKLRGPELRGLFDHQQATEVIYPEGKGQKTIGAGFSDRQLATALTYLNDQLKLGTGGDPDKAKK